jgi:hypothetical protein
VIRFEAAKLASELVELTYVTKLRERARNAR